MVCVCVFGHSFMPRCMCTCIHMLKPTLNYCRLRVLRGDLVCEIDGWHCIALSECHALHGKSPPVHTSVLSYMRFHIRLCLVVAGGVLISVTVVKILRLWRTLLHHTSNFTHYLCMRQLLHFDSIQVSLIWHQNDSREKGNLTCDWCRNYTPEECCSLQLLLRKTKNLPKTQLFGTRHSSNANYMNPLIMMVTWIPSRGGFYKNNLFH